MRPFRVTAGFCDVYGKFRDNTENLKEVSVTWVSPGIEKQGLRVGDRLSTIDGKSVVGMSKSEFLPLLNVDVPIGEKRVFVFVRKGFFLGKAITLTFTHNAH
jgi:C-terminal processing protease CtpA/Prc